MKRLILLVALAFPCLAQHPVALSWSWTQGTGDPATGFHAKRSTTSGGPYAVIGTVNSPTTMTFTDSVGCGVPYFYVVTAFNLAAATPTNPSGDSLPTNEATATAKCNPPGAPTGLTGTATLKVSLNWSPPPTAGAAPVNLSGAPVLKASLLWQAPSPSTSGTTYSAYRSTCATGASWVRVGANISTTTFDNYVAPVSTYCYRVTALASGTESAPSMPITIGYGLVSGL